MNGEVPAANPLGANSETAHLAGEMHAAEWALGDQAHDMSAGRDEPAKVLALAERLELLARVLRVRAEQRAPRPKAIEVSDAEKQLR